MLAAPAVVPVPFPIVSMMMALVPVVSGAVDWPLPAPCDVQIRGLVPPPRWPEGFQENPVRLPPTATLFPAAPAFAPAPVIVKKALPPV